MNAQKPYLLAIGANLTALRAMLATGIQDVDHGLEAIEQGSQNGAVGSIMATEALLKQAAILVQAIIILHRQS
jgi:hypothetical protein